MDDKKKKYVIPDAEIVNFNEEDIVTVSVGTMAGYDDGEDYTE